MAQDLKIATHTPSAGPICVSGRLESSIDSESDCFASDRPRFRFREDGVVDITVVVMQMLTDAHSYVTTRAIWYFWQIRVLDRTVPVHPSYTRAPPYPYHLRTRRTFSYMAVVIDSSPILLLVGWFHATVVQLTRLRPSFSECLTTVSNNPPCFLHNRCHTASATAPIL